MTGLRASSWQGERDGLIGRDAVLADLRELLAAGGRTVVLSGIAGAGKTSVLTVAARAAAGDGARVLALTCHASERDLAFGALADLVSTAPGGEEVLDRILPRPGAAAPHPLELRRRVLDWLRSGGEGRGQLLVVDDAQWCDDSSLSVLGFVAHRLAGTSISLLAAVRGEVPAPLQRHPLVELAALTDAQARVLLRQAGLELDAITLSSVLARGAGNPLALLELGRAAATRSAHGMIPSTVELAFAAQLAPLPERSRRLLLLAAACDGDLPALGRVVGQVRLVADLAPAEAAGLVAVADGVVRFRHPLARAAAYSSVTTAERVRAHALLARAYDGDPVRRTWHRAEAAVAPDEAVAADLVAAAERAQHQGAAAEAARFMRRAAELSPASGDRDRRLLEAATLGSIAGNFELAFQLGSRLRDECDDPSISARASVMAAYALSQTKRHSDALVGLVDSLERLLRVEPLWGWTTLTTLAVIAYRSGAGTELVGQWLGRYEHAVPAPLPPSLEAARAWVRVQIDPLARPADVLALVHQTQQPQDLPADVAGTHEMLLGAAAWMLGELPVASTRLRRAAELMRRADAPGQLPQTLIALGLVEFAMGDYDATDRTGQQVVDLAEAAGLSYSAGDGLELRAKVAGIRGDAATARQLCERVMLDLHVGEYLAMEANVRMTMSWVRLAEDDVLGAWDEVRWLFREDGEPRHVHICYRELGSYVATAVRAGAAADVAPVLDVAVRRLSEAGPYYRIQLARARALLAGEDAEPLHREAVTHPLAAQRPFEHANAQMEYGAWLRRRHRLTEARLQLQAALRVFERLDTPVWAELARAELRAAGVRTSVPSPRTAGLPELTGQEREIVRLAAAGMTNREIAASLYLSPKTVSTHLYNAFPKLGVTSRAQLRDVVDRSGQGSTT